MLSLIRLSSTSNASSPFHSDPATPRPFHDAHLFTQCGNPPCVLPVVRSRCSCLGEEVSRYNLASVCHLRQSNIPKIYPGNIGGAHGALAHILRRSSASSIGVPDDSCNTFHVLVVYRVYDAIRNVSSSHNALSSVLCHAVLIILGQRLSQTTTTRTIPHC